MDRLKGVQKRFCAGGYDDSKGRTMQHECKAIKDLREWIEGHWDGGDDEPAFK